MITWRPIIKRRSVARTGAQVNAYFHGDIEFPTALVDALERPERVHLFLGGAGELWIVPADDDDPSAYAFSPARGGGTGNRRRLTVVELYDRLGFADGTEPLRGDWYVDEGDRIVVRFRREIVGRSA